MVQMTEFDQTTTRGVQNPRIVDLISPGPGDDTVTFHIIEQRPWGSAAEQLDQLQEKLNNYLDYILDGYFSSQYPNYAGRRVVIHLECSAQPGEREESLLRAMEQYLTSAGMGFSWAVTTHSSA